MIAVVHRLSKVNTLVMDKPLKCCKYKRPCIDGTAQKKSGHAYARDETSKRQNRKSTSLNHLKPEINAINSEKGYQNRG